MINSRNFIHTFRNSADVPGRKPLPAFPVFLLAFLTVLVFFQIAVSPAPARAGERACHSLSGFVYDLRTLSPLPGARVTVESTVASDKYTTETDANGHYEIFEVPYGVFRVTAGHRDYRSDSIKLNIDRTDVRYDTSIESERDYLNRTGGDDDQRREGLDGKLVVEEVKDFAPKNNIFGVTGLIELPDCRTMEPGSYRVGYSIMRSRMTKGGSYKESNYSTSLGVGVSENVEASVFALQNFTKGSANQLAAAPAGAAAVKLPGIFYEQTGASIKYSNSLNLKKDGKKFNYALMLTHTNDGTDEIALPFEVPVSSDPAEKFILTPSYMSQGGLVYWDFAYLKPLFIDHRKLSCMIEFIQDSKHRWNIINGGLRLEFKNDSSIDLFMITDQNVKRITTGLGATMLFK